MARLASTTIRSGYSLPSTQFATISPGTLPSARSASRSRSSRFGSLTCGTSRKIGAVTWLRPVFERDATAWPRLLMRARSATSRLWPASTVDEAEAQPAAPLPLAGGDLAAAQAPPGGLGRDCQPEPLLRPDQRAGVVGADDDRGFRPDERRGVQALASLRVGLAPDRVREPPPEPRTGDLAAPGGLETGSGLAHGGGDGLLAFLHLGSDGGDKIGRDVEIQFH